MELRTYIHTLPHGGVTTLAKALSITPIYLSQLAAKQDGRVPSPELCFSIEKATGGAVPRQDLRPGDCWRIWPDLAHLAPPVEKAVA